MEKLKAEQKVQQDMERPSIEDYFIEICYVDGRTEMHAMRKAAASKWLPFIAKRLMLHALDPSAWLPPLSAVMQLLPEKLTKPWIIFCSAVAEVKFSFNGSMYIWNRLDAFKTGWKLQKNVQEHQKA